jgi:hypothetical protein
MKTQLNGERKPSSRGVASCPAQRKSTLSPISQVTSGKSIATAQRMQGLASNGPKSQQRATYQRLANQSHPVQRATQAGQQQKASASRGMVAQRIVHNGAVVDIATLNLATAKPHLARLRRVQGLLKSNKAVPVADTAYTYDPTDEAALQTRIKALETAELTARYTALKNSLINELTTLATSADWSMNRPAWVGTNIPGLEGSEVAGANVVPDLDAVRSQWLAFLGPGGLNQRHPRTGAIDPTRLISADGQRSIRYGNHERNSAPNQHHFHQETWTHQAASNSISVANVLRRVPVS